MSTTIADEWDAETPLPEPRQNRPVTLSHRLEAFVMRRLMGIFRAQPVEKASRRMGSFMRLFGPMLRPIHARGHANLKLIYPDMTAAERAAILRGAWENLGATVAEFAHLEEIGERVEVIGKDMFAPYLSGEKKAVFVSSHSANWEAIPSTFRALGLKFAIVYRAANNPLVDADIIEMRGRAMTRRQCPKGKRSARKLLQALQDGLSLCMLTDQKLNDGISVPFLGHPAMTAPAAARLALKEEVPVIPVKMVRLPGASFRMTIEEPLSVEPSGDIRADTEALTAIINERLGQHILDHPDQWLIFHRRWPRKLTG